jgi:hypothetical protein
LANSLASSGVEQEAMTLVSLPWNSAMRFSRGITFQSCDSTSTNSCLPLKREAFSASLWSWMVSTTPTCFPSANSSSPLRMMGKYLPTLAREESSSRSTMSTYPASRAEVTMRFLSADDVR